jgi:hypothetical protein
LESFDFILSHLKVLVVVLKEGELIVQPFVIGAKANDLEFTAFWQTLEEQKKCLFSVLHQSATHRPTSVNHKYVALTRLINASIHQRLI